MRAVESCRGTVTLEYRSPVPVHAGPSVVIRVVDRFGIRVGALHHKTFAEGAIDGYLKRVVVRTQITIPHIGGYSSAVLRVIRPSCGAGPGKSRGDVIVRQKVYGMRTDI